MLRVNDILLAVEALTQERFSDLKAYRNVVRKGFKRPSFLTEVGKQTMEDFTHFTVDRTAQVKITFSRRWMTTTIARSKPCLIG